MTTCIIIPGEVTRPVFDEAAHRYTVGGKEVPSVSRLLKPLTDLAYKDIDKAVLREAAEFGTAVHACTEYYDKGELDEDSVLPEWRPYLDAYLKWRRDVRPEILHIEDRLGCSKYAGTLDRICRIDGKLWVVDLKTTSEIHPHVGVQLAAYAALAEKFYGGTYRRAALQLHGDGTYKVFEKREIKDETCFTGLLGIYHWAVENDYC